MSPLFDPGLQPERTHLSWRRTCLALGVAGATAARFTAESAWIAAMAIGFAAVVLAAATHQMAARRYRRLTGPNGAPGDARAMMLITATVVLVGVGSGTYVLEGALTQ